MDSMKRSEANSSHHQNKVVLTNQGTDSNSKINCSGSNFNNNTVSNKQQHQTASLNQESTLPNTSTSSTSTTSDIHKDSNFEYDDNEWDVGIGDLIIDLDADIEKSSVNNQQQEIQSGTILIGENSSQPTSEPILPSLPSVGSLDVLGSDSNKASLKKSQNALSSPIPSKDCDSLGASAVKEDLPPNSAKLLISKATSVKGGTTSSTPSKHHSSSSSSSSSSLPSVTSFASGHHLHHHYHHHHHHHKSNSSVDSRNQHTTNLSKHSVLLSQLNSIRNSNSSPFETSGLKHKHSSSTFSSRLSNMSSTNNSSGGKSATKLAVDHQATLDKGLKMKIKRTKPGTKTSEAKHEIVKAEQNGTSSLSSSADENNGNSNSSSNSSNKKHSSQSQSQAQVASSTIQQQSQQGSKRGSSGHRRDKAKEKTTHHNQREKNEHNSTSTGNSTPSGVDRSCSCTHEIQINGIQQPCSGAFCIKSKTSDQQMTSLTQRLSNQNNSSTSTTNSLFSSNSNTGSSLSSISSSSNTPNAPGPPSSKDNIKMHSKLRNGGTKGRGSRATPTTTADSSSVKTTTTSTSTTGSSSSGTNTSVSLNTPSTSPVAFLPPRPEKRKSKDESPSPVNGGSGSTSSSMSGSVINSSNVNNANMTCMANSTLGTQSVVNPMTGLNVQISTKKCKSTASPCTISPVLLECPEQDCSKKYKHANGLRYHQSHAHGSVSSMDEDSSHPPESPQRVAPPTTPSPLPTVQSTNVLTIPTLTAVSMTTNTSASTTTTSTSSALQATVSVAVTLNASQNATTTTMTTKTTTAATSSTTTNPPCSAPSPSLLMTVNVSSVPVPISTSHSILTTTTSALPVTSAADSQPTATSPSIAGGSITTGVAGQPQPHVMPASSSTLLSSALNGSALSVPISSQLQSGQVQTPSPQQQQSLALQANNNGVATTPTRCDPSAKCKPGILRFGPLHGEVDHNARLTPVAQGSSNIPGTPGSNVSNVQPSTPVRPSNVGVTGGILAMQPATPGTPEGSNMKSQNCSKQKKNRKSPGPSEFDVAAANRAEDVQSPAYSDISDDSAPVVDASDLDKSKGPSLPDVQKKPNEAGQLGPLSGYGMYPYYPAMPHQSSYYSSDHPGKPPGLGHSPLGPNAAVDYKSKEPPLDLMNKPNQHQHQQQQHPPPPQPGQPPHLQLPPGEANAQPNKDCPTGPPAHAGAGKMMQHFYPYGYVRHVFLCKAVTSTFNAYDS
ncbi:uncharacterized protein sbb isoform X3 [Ochlerotatus camptorhynchus]|uniref:uncharacterized protein sbb isoform X3 n=1 Tax=Ochlerotatus camptorhynchus TaxID=644619 RepID=UPI0031DDBC91